MLAGALADRLLGRAGSADAASDQGSILKSWQYAAEVWPLRDETARM
jgi:hypothetical protein